MAYTELVPFRMFSMPCCGFSLCWVNSRLPNCCPDCGSRVYFQLKSGDRTLVDAPATLRIRGNAHDAQAALAQMVEKEETSVK